jgi:hypothetical protein
MKIVLELVTGSAKSTIEGRADKLEYDRMVAKWERLETCSSR